MRLYTAQEMRVHACDTSVLSAANPPGVEAWIVKTMAMLRQAADDLEREENREKRYEYADKFGEGVVSNYHTDTIRPYGELFPGDASVVRRSVGEWEDGK